MINPADLKRMLQRTRATAQSAQKSTESSQNSESSTRNIMSSSHEHSSLRIAYSSHFSSDYSLDDEEYRAEYDVELNAQGDASEFSNISSTIVPLYSTSTSSDDTNDDIASAAHLALNTAQQLREIYEQTVAQLERETLDSGIDDRCMPTPAIMAKKRDENTLTFASLDNRDLPVVREYSAGGLVFDDDDCVAIIARHSRSGHLEWCLPKGHIEKGETPDQTAVREIHEETGILGEVFDSIATIDYWFTGESQRIHKLVHHYALHMVGGRLSVEGDPDHEAEDATWVKFDDLCDVLSYPNERRIVWLYAKRHRRNV